VPNIANYIVNTEPFNARLKLKGYAIGNACWGGNETKVNCNGPNHAQMMSDIYWGKGLTSKNNYEEIQKTCDWPPNDLNTGPDSFEPSPACEKLLETQSRQVGPHNIYNIYDNCPRGRAFVKRTGLSMYDINQAHQVELNSGGAVSAVEHLSSKHEVPLELLFGDEKIDVSTPGNTGGGYPWSCGASIPCLRAGAGTSCLRSQRFHNLAHASIVPHDGPR
jgi:hypothetical protein